MPHMYIACEKTVSNPAYTNESFLAELYYFDVPAPQANERPSVVCQLELWYNETEIEADNWVLVTTYTSQPIRYQSARYQARIKAPIPDSEVEEIEAKLIGKIFYVANVRGGIASQETGPHYLTVVVV